MAKTYTDPEHVLTTLNSEVYWLSEALWNYLHEPTDEHLKGIVGTAKEVALEAQRIADFVHVGHETMKGAIVDDD